MNIPENTIALAHFDNIEKEVQELINCKRDFTAFIYISLAIEFIGSFKDGKGFDNFNSKARFKNGLDYFTDKWYSQHKSWILLNLRGALVHQLRPGKEILLSSVCVNNEDKEDHLTLRDEKILFVLEQLFDDFKEAVEELKSELSQNNSLNKTLPKSDYIQKKKSGATGNTLSNSSVPAKKK